MKRLIILFAAIPLLAACAKSSVPSTGDSTKRVFDEWVKVHNDGWTKTALGCYIISMEGGSGAAIGDQKASPYVLIDFTVSDLDENVTLTTYESVARRCGMFKYQYYFGPQVVSRADNSMFAGVDEIVSMMKPGSKCKFVAPGWTLTSERYNTAEEYVANYDGVQSHAIYEIELVEAISDIEGWQIEKIEEYIGAKLPEAVKDTTGFYKAVLREPVRKITNDTTVYINYTGRLLNGHVFDTSIRDTAVVNFKKDFDATRSYKPQLINWKPDYTLITMGSNGSTVVRGFSYLIGTMGAYEKSVGIFYSPMGYGSESSNATSSSLVTIPAYSPLIFEVELVDKP